VLIAVVSTVIVPVAHPDIGNAGIVVTLVLVDWALFLRTSLLILPSWAVVGLVALLVKWYTEGGPAIVRRTFELVLEADVFVAVLLVARISAVVESVTDLGWMETMLVSALELARGAVEGRATLWLVGPVPTVVLTVTAPPEGDALVGCFTEEVSGRAVRTTGDSVLFKYKVFWTRTDVLKSSFRLFLGSKEAKGMTATVIRAWIHRRTWLTKRMVNGNVHGPVDCRENCGGLLASVLVASLNRLGLPVAPIHIVFKYREGKDVMKSCCWRGTS